MACKANDDSSGTTVMDCSLDVRLAGGVLMIPK